MVTQLLEHERICTTLQKAQALQRYADRLITLAKRGTPTAYDKAKGIVRSDKELHKLFTTMALRYHGRSGGYTRVLPMGSRDYDAAPMAFIEFVGHAREFHPAPRGPTVNPLLPQAAQVYLKQLPPS
eukprot:CAMPEP_0119102638 /NCGR_PEP_ID=MMETSP1180-20130426/1316_1 /TAXON_ID=3052 ORGANISM="Chlamydomonas cf sp, Strain CCMP681" /NCGR_SAMPLE_ID=MMETSP1180 /ASSEMBLY_ACC=CAM_ASM_000741 /LENGTH=126 /DNA_ID=CAMNT_0007086959 /DNA_START=196 /DNA_END=576 /DNA_ORIENTATION=-